MIEGFRVHKILLFMSSSSAALEEKAAVDVDVEVAVSIKQHYVIDGGLLVSPVVIPATLNVTGKMFFELAKASPVIVKLLQGKTLKGKRPLGKTTVVEDLCKLSRRSELAEDAGLDLDGAATSKRRKINPVAEESPVVVEFMGPSYGDCAGIPLKGLDFGGRRGRAVSVWLELTVETIMHLQQAVQAQGSQEGPHCRKPAAAHGAIRHDAERDYVMCKYTEDNVQRQRFFKIAGRDLELVVQEAQQFLEELV